jgi:hypothetical protein
VALDLARLRAIARGEASDTRKRCNPVTHHPDTGSDTGSAILVTGAGYAENPPSYASYAGYAKNAQGWKEKGGERVSGSSIGGVTPDVTHPLPSSRVATDSCLSVAPEARRCTCGEPAHFCEGWSLRGPGGARWYCAECRPSSEAVLDVAGGLGEPSAPHVEVHADWWRQPVEGWAEGRLVIRNMVSGVETIIDLRGV